MKLLGLKVCQYGRTRDRIIICTAKISVLISNQNGTITIVIAERVQADMTKELMRNYVCGM